MKIVVEESEVELDLPKTGVTLQKIVEEVEDFLMEIGKVPVALNIDGVEFSQEELEDRQGDIMGGEETLTFGVKGIFRYLCEHLDGASAANQELLKKITTFASEIHTSEKTLSGKTLVAELTHFFDFWLRLGRLLPEEMANQSFGGKCAEELFGDLRKLFEEIVAAMEAEDFVLASDLLQYEVIPAIETVETVIPSLKARLDEREQADKKSFGKGSEKASTK